MVVATNAIGSTAGGSNAWPRLMCGVKRSRLDWCLNSRTQRTSRSRAFAPKNAEASPLVVSNGSAASRSRSCMSISSGDRSIDIDTELLPFPPPMTRRSKGRLSRRTRSSCARSGSIDSDGTNCCVNVMCGRQSAPRSKPCDSPAGNAALSAMARADTSAGGRIAMSIAVVSGFSAINVVSGFSRTLMM